MAQGPVKQPHIIRVAVINGTDSLSLKIAGPYRIVLLNTLEDLMKGNFLHETEITPDFSGVKIGEKALGVFGIKVLQMKEGSIYINRRRFRGSIDIIRDQNMKLLIVNHIDVEEYLYGVLYHEVSHRWPMEVLKAQAIASRTYAIYQSIVNKDKTFDLTSDIYSQVYGGRTSETGRTNRAVMLTTGKVLKFNGEVFPAYFHATCGGHTSDASTLWKIDIPPLKGRTCPYCADSPHFKWENIMPIDEIEQKLERGGYNIGDTMNIRIIERDSANRILKLEIEGSERTFTISGNSFRLIVEPNIIRSANFILFLNKDNLRLKGFGWGHGIGMCQWGAYHMARMGKSAEEILNFYYPGAVVCDLDGTK